MRQIKLTVRTISFLVVLLLTNTAWANTGTLEGLLSQANSYYSSNQPYQALELYSQGYNQASGDARFKEGVIKSQRLILSWSLGAHSQGQASIAAIGYNAVLNSATADQGLKNLTLRNKTLADKGQAPFLQPNYVAEGTRLLTTGKPYHALDLFSEGYSYFKDAKTYEGLLKSANTILSWSKAAHQGKNYNAALYGYNAVMENAFVPAGLKAEVQKLYNLAQNNKPLLSASQYYNLASKITNPYEALKVYVEANTVYPTDKRFIEGINKSRNTIFAWSKGAHKQGYFAAALVGYEVILNSPLLNTAFKAEVQNYKNFADQGKILYTVAEYQARLKALSNPYQILDVAEEALAVYPGNASFISSLDKGRNTILAWSKGAHEKGQFAAAMFGYDRILNSKLLASGLKLEVDKLRQHAQRNRVLYSKEALLKLAVSLKYSNPYEAKELFKDSLFLYPGYYTQVNINGMIESAKVILSWSKGAHSQGYFSTAIYGYEAVLATNYITDSMFSEATINKELAKKSIVLNNTGKYITNTNYNLTLTEMVNRQVTAGAVRSGKAGETYWVNATADEIRQYVDPNLALQGNPFQFLSLSGICGATVEELNALLTGKGILENQGTSFRDAARLHNINEIYLVNHALLETGHGTSKLATGIVYNGMTVYNVFGIGAYDRDPNGLGAKKAYEEGWDTIEKAIVGGAKFISQSYINNPTHQQDTLYKMRWNPAAPATHQYATDIGWAQKQANLIAKFFETAKSVVLRFDIPVFQE